MTLGLQHSDMVNGEPPISLTVFPTPLPKGIARGHCFGPAKLTDFSIVTQTLKQLRGKTSFWGLVGGLHHWGMRAPTKRAGPQVCSETIAH